MHAMRIEELVGRYEEELVRLGYSAGTLRNYRIFWKQIAAYFRRRGQRYFSDEVAEAFLDHRYRLSEISQIRSLTRYETEVRQMVRKLVFFHAHGTVRRLNGVAQRYLATEEFLQVLKRYASWCVEHGYADSTRARQRDHAIKFFAYLESNSVRRCSEIGSSTVIQYIDSLTEYSYRSVGLIVTDLRTVLSFLYLNGSTAEDLTHTLPHQQTRQQTGLPAVWSREDVLKLLNAIDRGSPCGKRDYAILLLVAMLGIRAGDVRALKLENLHWNTNTIAFVQAKTKQAITLPLLKDVGWALIDYLRHGRPKSDSPYVFLRHLPPFEKVHGRNCFYHIVRRCIRIARVTPSGDRNRGMHSLRRTLATTLLSEGTPLSTIAGVLGHGSTDSTSSYLRNDIDALRQCALDSPEVV